MSEPEIPELANSSEDQFVVEQLLDDLIRLVSDARSSLRSSTAILNREEVLELLTEAREKFPDEVRAARWLIKERKLFIEKVQQEKIEIIEEAQKRSAELVSRLEVVKAAQNQARHIIQAAEEESARNRYQLELYFEKKLNEFENVLGSVHRSVQEGKARLQNITTEPLSGEDIQRDIQNELNFDRQGYEMEPPVEAIDEPPPLQQPLQQEAEPQEIYVDPLLDPEENLNLNVN